VTNSSLVSKAGGRHFLQIPGPTNVPERVLRALAQPVIDHRSPAFAHLALEVLDGLTEFVETSSPIALYPSSGTGAWQAALVNLLSPDDAVLLCENGHFARLWGRLAEQLGIEVVRQPGDWRLPPQPREVERQLAEDTNHTIRAVLVVHNETSTGVTSHVPEIRAALDRHGHPALLLVDTISSLASSVYRHDEWRVDVTIGCSQKGFMLPPGLAFNAISEKALAATDDARLPKGYWDWKPAIEACRTGFFPYTPPTTLLFGLREALAILREEGLENVIARHARHAAATRVAVEAWGLEVFCRDPHAHSNALTAVLVPEHADAGAVRAYAYNQLNMSLGTGLGDLAGRVFRIGHLGDFNDLMLLGTLGGVELALDATGISFERGGITAAMESLAAWSDAHLKA
jgi:alanine-glyoxylate transaminase/serine-glyoxylate transaminase/serine-pyruvate transaminase